MRRRAARGAGSRARRRLEPPLCRPLARRRPVKQTSPIRVPQGAWPPRALNSRPGPSRHRQANRTTSHLKRSRTKTTVVSIRSASDRLETQRLDAQVDCSYRRFLGCLDSLALGPNRLAIKGLRLCTSSPTGKRLARRACPFRSAVRVLSALSALPLRLVVGTGVRQTRLCEEVAGIIVPCQILEALCIARTWP